MLIGTLTGPASPSPQLDSRLAAHPSGTLQRLSLDDFARHLAEESGPAEPQPRAPVVTGTGSQTNDSGQIPVAPATQGAVVSGLQGLVPVDSPSAAAPAASSSPSDASSTNTPDDDYWASQPAAVQQLRDIQDPNQRAAVASQLAGEGYQIDVPIMVWGWDPAITMQMRESYGYTWVPALGQQRIEVAPGLSCPGLISYNPANPPPGSIAVSVPT